MIATLPFLLHRAEVSLYPADTAGNPLMALPIWIGGRAEKLALSQEVSQVESTPSGSANLQYEPTYEEHEIRFERIWAIPLNTLQDFQPARGRMVMVIKWTDRATGLWTKRIYYGVQCRRYNLESFGIIHFGADQAFRAEHFDVSSGTSNAAGSELPVLGDESCEYPLLFTHDDPLTVGDYFLGNYQFDVGVKIGFSKVFAQAGASNTTLTLEVNGSLTASTLVIASGSGEVSASATFNVTVPAGQPIRWKVTGGPGSGKSTLASVTCLVTETG